MPSISVILPVLNGERYLKSALDSIERQSIDSLEVIAIDDGSTDSSKAILHKYPLPIQILQGAGEGPAAARNLGLEKAQGEVITFIDADDMWPAHKLEKQLERLADGYDIVSGQIIYFEEEAGLQPREGSRTETIYFMHLGGAVFHRSVFERLGGFDPDQRYGEDLDLFFRAMEQKMRITLLPQPTLYYRRHQDSMTYYQTDREKLDFKKVIHKSIMRRKRLGIGDLPKFESFVEEICGAQ